MADTLRGTLFDDKVHRYRAAGGLCTGVDAGHRGLDGGGHAVDLQAGLLAHTHGQRIGRVQQGLKLQF